MLPGSDVVMATTPSREIVPGYGMGLVTYLTGDYGAETFRGLDMARTIEDLVRLPIGQKLYLRPTWRELQKRPGRLDPDEYWKVTFALARQHGKRVGFRVMMSCPDMRAPALPDFVLERVPMVRLEGEWKRKGRESAFYEEPRYDHPYFQEAFRELNALLAAELDGSPLVEYFDTFMYGFWGEGHTWPLTNHPFPDDAAAERTFVRMFEVQLEHWKKTPLATNTQPDFSRVGNSELVDRTVRSHNWLRTDTIFIENEQIEALSNRPPWVAAVIEAPMADGSPDSLEIDEGVSLTDNVIAHVMDVGANYWSVWNWHAEKAENVLRYYRRASRDDRHDRPAHRLPRAAGVDLDLRRQRPERAGGGLRQRRDRRRSGRAAGHGPRRRRAESSSTAASTRAGRCRARSARRDCRCRPGPRGRDCGSAPSSRSRECAIPSPGPVTRSSSRTGRCACGERGGSGSVYSGSASRSRWCSKETSRFARGPLTTPKSLPVS